MLRAMPATEDEPIRATWNRRFRGLQILAFADHTYLLDFGSDKKPPFMTLGWSRWYPCSLDFPRLHKL